MGNTHWGTHFEEREWRLITNCRVYADNDPAGLPGHNLMLIVSKMADLLDSSEKNVKWAVGYNLPAFMAHLCEEIPPGEGQRHNITLDGENGRLELTLMLGEAFQSFFIESDDLKKSVEDSVAEIRQMLNGMGA